MKKALCLPRLCLLGNLGAGNWAESHVTYVVTKLLMSFYERQSSNITTEGDYWRAVKAANPKATRISHLIRLYMVDVIEDFAFLTVKDKVQKVKDTFAAALLEAATHESARAARVHVEQLRGKYFNGVSDEVFFRKCAHSAVEYDLAEELTQPNATFLELEWHEEGLRRINAASAGTVVSKSCQFVEERCSPGSPFRKMQPSHRPVHHLKFCQDFDSCSS